MLNALLSLYRNWRYRQIIRRRRFDTKTPEQIFSETYQRRYWKSRESVSGQGSELRQTQAIRAALPAVLRQYGIRSLLDLPCGDFNWMQHVDLNGIAYTGADIVRELIEQNQQKYGNAERRFIHLDLLADPLPTADAILIRDALVHFSNHHIGQALQNLCSSKIRYLLTTTFPGIERNEDIQTGFWRPINLLKPPFSLPEPLWLLHEGSGGAFADKSLALWEIPNML